MRTLSATSTASSINASPPSARRPRIMTSLGRRRHAVLCLLRHSMLNSSILAQDVVALEFIDVAGQFIDRSRRQTAQALHDPSHRGLAQPGVQGQLGRQRVAMAIVGEACGDRATLPRSAGCHRQVLRPHPLAEPRQLRSVGPRVRESRRQDTIDQGVPTRVSYTLGVL